MKIKEKREIAIKWYKDKRYWVSSIGLFIIIIMVGSALNMWEGGTEETKYTYNGYDFIKTEQGWAGYINNQYINFNYGPKEVEDITIPFFVVSGDKIYVLYNPEEKNSGDYFIQRLFSLLKYKQYNAFLACDREENCPNIPVLDCSSNNFKFYIKEANNNKFYSENNCFVMEVNKTEEIKVLDRLSYKLLGIMQ